MIIRTQEKYKTDASAVVLLAIDLLIFVLTLLNILVGTYLRRERCPSKSRPKSVQQTEHRHEILRSWATRLGSPP